MAKTLAEIAPELEKPFSIECIDLLPKGSFEKDGKTMCMALPYADKRVYEDRLNALAPGEWSTPPPVAIATAQKIIVYVTVIVCGIVHTDVGEASLLDSNGKPSENAATESQAQGFKRACSQFGLGRYLYDLEKAWVPYNKQRKQIDLDGAGIARIVSGMYKKAGLCLNDETSERTTPKPTPASHAQTPAQPPNTKEAHQKQPANQSTSQQPVQLSAEAQKKRFYEIYDQFKALNLFEYGDDSTKNIAAFYTLATDILNATITNYRQLTASRLNRLDKYAKERTPEQAQPATA